MVDRVPRAEVRLSWLQASILMIQIDHQKMLIGTDLGWIQVGIFFADIAQRAVISLQKSDEFAQNVHFFHFSDIIYMSVLKIIMIISSTNEITNKNYMRHGRCDFITEFQVISLVGWGYSWLGDHLGIISPVLILKKRGTD